MKKLITLALIFASLTVAIPTYASFGPLLTTGDLEDIQSQLSSIQAQINILQKSPRLGNAIYNPSVLTTSSISIAGAALTANNLSDLASSSTAATTLGLGTSSSPTFTSVTISTTSPVTIPNISGEIRLPSPTALAAGVTCGTTTGVTETATCINAFLSVAATGTVIVPGPYWYNYSLPINDTTNKKYLSIRCVPGTTIFNYTGTGTSTNWNYGSSGSASGYAAHNYGIGVDGCTFLGPDPNGTTTFASVGGSNGAEGWSFTNNRVIGFGQAISLGNNTWQTNINYNLFIGNGKNITSVTQSNAGERNNYIGNTFADVAGTVTSSTLETCLDINGTVGTNFTANNFDDCGITFRSTARGVNMDGNYFENPGASSANYPAYKYITTTSVNSTIQIANLSVMQDATSATSTPSAFISNTGTLVINGYVAQNNGTSTPLLVTDAASTASLSVVGAVNYAGNSFTKIDEQAPTAVSGLQAPYASFGNSVPSASVSTGTILGYSVNQFLNTQTYRIVNNSATGTIGIILTFGKAWNSIPNCTISPASGTTVEWIPRYSITTTSTLTYGDATAMVAGTAAVVNCFGNPN